MNTLLHFVLIAVQVVLIFGLADFVAGVVHWAEDAYFTEDTPIIGPQFIRPNIVHHHFPRYFTKLSWWESASELVLVGLVLLAIAWPLGFISWQLILFVVVSVNANEIHKMAHRTRAENGRLVSLLQDWRILQTPRQHGLHHSDPKNTYYCPVTNYVNPVLERMQFWDHLENLIERLTGATHRHDTAVRGQGPGPEWLAEFKPPSRKPCAKHCGLCAQCTRAGNADSRAASAARRSIRNHAALFFTAAEAPNASANLTALPYSPKSLGPLSLSLPPSFIAFLWLPQVATGSLASRKRRPCV